MCIWLQIGRLPQSASLITFNNECYLMVLLSIYVSVSGIVKDTLDTLVPVLNKLIESAFDKVLTKIDEKLDPVKNVREELQVVQESLDQQRRLTKYDLDNLEQYTRRENIKISGLAEEEGEDLAEKVIKIASDIGIRVTRQEISAVHRIGKTMQRKPRAVICRFINRSIKDDLILNRKKLKDIPTYKGTVFINEDLTTLRYKLMTYAKSVPNVDRINSRNGKLYCNLRDKNLVVIETADDLFKLGATEVDYTKLGLDFPNVRK